MKPDVQVDAMRERLRQRYAGDQEERLIGNLRRIVEDPLRPESESGRLSFNPMVLLLAALTAFAAGVFLYFSFGGQ